MAMASGTKLQSRLLLDLDRYEFTFLLSLSSRIFWKARCLDHCFSGLLLLGSRRREDAALAWRAEIGHGLLLRLVDFARLSQRNSRISQWSHSYKRRPRHLPQWWRLTFITFWRGGIFLRRVQQSVHTRKHLICQFISRLAAYISGRRYNTAALKAYFSIE